MTVYVDDLDGPYRVGRLNGMWCHLTADSMLELLEFADRLGLSARGCNSIGGW